MNTDFPVQVNGKWFCTIPVPVGHVVRKAVLVPGKLLNIVVNEKDPPPPPPEQRGPLHQSIPEV